MYNIKYILYSGLRTYEKMKRSRLVPEKGNMLHVRGLRINAAITKITYHIDLEGQEDSEVVEVHAKQEQGIDLSQHYALVKAGWAVLGTKPKIGQRRISAS